MAMEVWRPRRGLMRSPSRGFARFEREMEDMLEPFFRGFPWGRRAEPEWGWMPAVDMIDHKDGVVLRADLPGLEEKDIEVSVQDGTLIIQGERKEEPDEKGEEYYYCERPAGAFTRSLLLPPGVEKDKVKATFKNGVLEIHLPKTKEAKAKRIEIKSA